MEEEWIDVGEKKDGGILKKILTPGTGDEFPPKGSEVKVDYVGTLEDGTKFDSSRDRNQPFDFSLGKGAVIQGWDQGVATMRKGEKSILKIQSEYGYGKSGSGKIPPNATLIFEVELHSWQEKRENVSTDGGIQKIVVKAAQDRTWEHPSDDEKVTVNYTLFGEDKRVIEDRSDVIFVVGDESVHAFLNESVKKIAQGETARLYIKASHAFGVAGHAALGVKANEPLEALVTVKEYVHEKSSWELKDEEKVELASRLRTEATELFKAGKFGHCVIKYERALRALEYDTSFSDELKAQSAEIKKAVHLNVAVCALKRSDFSKVVKEADAALAIDGRNVKGLYLRGKAFASTAEYDRAEADLNFAREISPEDKGVVAELASLKKKIAAQNAKDRAVYSKMFA